MAAIHRSAHCRRRRACTIVLALLCLTLLAPAARAETGAPAATPAARRAFLPLVRTGVLPECPYTGESYDLIPVSPPPSDRPAASHADLNLALRGSRPASASLKLVDYGGETDGSAPQFPGLFADRRVPNFTSAHQVYNWDWSCGRDGCRGGAITSPGVTLLGLSTRGGEPLFAPSRGPEIYGGGYVALVLYAEHHHITLKYTREDNVVGGYTVQLENICVDPALVDAYRAADKAGRAELPALRNGEALGTAHQGEIRVAIRDCGAYLDPRSRKDWWQGL